MTVPEALTDPRLRRWPLRRRRVSTAAGTLGFVVPTSSDEVLTRLGDAADPEDLPYWADVWPSSLAIARLLTRRVVAGGLAGWHAIDLGCGVGVCGVAAGRLGAAVTFLDAWPDAVRFARFNLAANTSGVAGGRASGEHGAGPRSEGEARFDWHRDALPGPVDASTLLLMADLFYERRDHGALAALARHVVARGGTVLAADPCRDVADAWFTAFVAEHGAAIAHDATHDGKQRVRVRIACAGRGLPDDRPAGAATRAGARR